ncbi:selenoprotein M-like isoform X1 [Homalodisca vitripennis]|uniref:selenoprotein M-like isoform X1 n=1 Tax=Homalodisca vitripennis TaxID=197043 RepID=UPI001EECF381|nr:selenoprotein M-like isoform X1 [Homalodisca vitripennis]
MTRFTRVLRSVSLNLKVYLRLPLFMKKIEMKGPIKRNSALLLRQADHKAIYKNTNLQSCRGCSLNRLPDVKSFIYSDLPKYRGVEFHPIHGAVPHLVLFDESDKELDRINLSSLSRDECNELVRKWFSLKEEETETTASGKVHGEL